MSFGFFNAPANFQDYINKISTKKLDIFIIFYLNDIFIYTKDPGQSHVNAVQWVFKKLRKNSLFVNLKKGHFYNNKVCFLEYVMLAQRVQIEDKKIEVVKNWLEPKFVRDIQVF